MAYSPALQRVAICGDNVVKLFDIGQWKVEIPLEPVLISLGRR